MENKKYQSTRKRGDIVIIHEDPNTKQIPEGEARLIKKLGSESFDGLELWTVRFLNEDSTCTRFI
jgi:hypothetical protein